MATFEDAAEDLVVKLRGLDSEIEESEQKLEDLRGRIEEVGSDVEQEWTALDAALSSFLDRVGDEQTQLDQAVRTALQALTDTHNAVLEQGADARTEIAEGDAQLDALAAHATALEPGVASLAAEGGEEPARRLAARAGELEAELERLVEEARDFLRDDVIPGIDEAASLIRERCQSLHGAVASGAVSALQASFDDWETKVDELESYVSAQGFVASREHAMAVVAYAIEGCRTASEAHITSFAAMRDAALQPLVELVAEVQRTGQSLKNAASRLVAELDETLSAARGAGSAFDSVRDLLASYSFVGM